LNKKFGDYYLPARFQYVILREYLARINAVFNMPQGEPIFTKTNIRLRSLINNLKPKSILVLLSMYVLPENKIIRNEIISKMIKKKIELHLIFEKTVIKSKKDFKKINNILKLNKFNKQNENN
jgi:sporadic carbohydrate cluster protein (TIGR04323 family)